MHCFIKNISNVFSLWMNYPPGNLYGQKRLNVQSNATNLTIKQHQINKTKNHVSHLNIVPCLPVIADMLCCGFCRWLPWRCFRFSSILGLCPETPPLSNLQSKFCITFRILSVSVFVVGQNVMLFYMVLRGFAGMISMLATSRRNTPTSSRCM